MLFALWSSPRGLEAQQLDNVLGVSSCATSACHGSAIPRTQTRILRNEFRTWLEEDSHSDAYDVLLGEDSRQIIRNLQGFGSPIESAETSAVCLDCHATSQDRSHVTDGVSCESCHGGARAWIDRHDEVSSPEEALALGMVPTWEPETRADVCLSCHLGTEEQFVTHEIMAAGHPRLAFELETFTYRQPAHFPGPETGSYSERKPESADSGRVWAIGQGVHLRNYARLLSSSPGESRWPEFAKFDCFSCHQAVERDQGPPEPPTVGSGLLALNRSSALMFREVIAVLDPEHLESLDVQMDSLDQALAEPGSELRRVGESIVEIVSADLGHIATREWDRSDLLALLDRLTSPRLAATYRTYADAEQVTMAVQALVAGLENDQVPDQLNPALRSLTSLFEATTDEFAFRIGAFRENLADFRRSLPP